MGRHTHKLQLENFTDVLIKLGRDAANQTKSGGQLFFTYGIRLAPSLSAAVGEQDADDDEGSGAGKAAASHENALMKRRRRVRI